jgi:tetratricopeptide (TPR) repeat protein
VTTNTDQATTPGAVAAPSSDVQSIAQLEHAVQQNAADIGSWQKLGVACLHRAVATYNPDDYEIAQRAFERADALTPDQDATILGRGALALSRHQFAEALALGSRVHARNPVQPDALAVIVDANVELGRYDDAQAALQDLLDRHPGLPAFSRASYLLELHGDNAAAVQAMRQAETAGATSTLDVATVVTFQGDIELARGRYDAAAQRYATALRPQPDHVNATVGQARVWAVQNQRARAIDSLIQLTRRVPLPAAVILLGDLQSLDGRTADAAQSYGLVRAINTLQQAAGQVTDLEMAVFEADHGDPAHALDLARRAYAERPDNVYVDDALAWSQYRAGDLAGARPLISRAQRLGSADPMIEFHAAAIAAATGDVTAARASMAKVTATNPWFSFRLHADVVALAEHLGVRSAS